MNENYLDVRTLVIDKYRCGQLTIDTLNGITHVDLEETLQNKSERILKSFGRDFGTILAKIDNNPRWINDFALAVIVTELKNKLEKYEEKYGSI
jgi:predicted hydrocarbon binding protein